MLNDISEELLILNKITINRLFESDKPGDAVALYIFYYKTAKWQKTDKARANDKFVKKGLKWGDNRLSNAKEILKDLGLINIIQRRKDGKIVGWYVEVKYIVSDAKTSQIKVETYNPQNEVLDSNNPQNQELGKSRSRKQGTNALKQLIEMLKDTNIKNISVDKLPDEFQKIAKEYHSYKIEYIFNYWKTTLNKPRAVFDDKRKQIISKALENYSMQDCLLVIDGCSKSPHHNGQNDLGKKYHDLSLLFRDSEHIERFISYNEVTHAPDTYQQRTNRLSQSQINAAEKQRMRDSVNRITGRNLGENGSYIPTELG